MVGLVPDDAQSQLRSKCLQVSTYRQAQARELVIVSEAEYDDEAKTYIQRLQKDFLLPIEYRRFDMNLRHLV